MIEIQCPKCHEKFSIDESGYNEIVKQIRNDEFTNELNERLEQARVTHEKEVQLAESKIQAKSAVAIEQLNSEIAKLKSSLAQQEQIREQEKELACAQIRDAQKDQINKQASRIQELEANLKTQEQLHEKNQRLAVQEAVASQQKAIGEKEQEVLQLKGKMELATAQQQNEVESLKRQYEIQLKAKDELIAQYKDFRTKTSTKIVGESLERHCEDEFNKYRSTAFSRAYFEKDNDATTGSKGDYIFRDFTPEGEEYISIMFEMKNEVETTATKHKNEDFFKELDKDRKEKNCEYAILVSMLELDSELYNSGIVDVSHRYPKMFVIRPQFLIPMITLLRNAAASTIQYRDQLAEMRDQHLDITNFEADLEDFKKKFGSNYERAQKYFKSAIDDIDRSIKALNKTKEDLTTSLNQLGYANNKAQDLSIKSLTRHNPTMAQKFKDLKAAKESTEADVLELS